MDWSFFEVLQVFLHVLVLDDADLLLTDLLEVFLLLTVLS